MHRNKVKGTLIHEVTLPRRLASVKITVQIFWRNPCSMLGFLAGRMAKADERLFSKT